MVKKSACHGNKPRQTASVRQKITNFAAAKSNHNILWTIITRKTTICNAGGQHLIRLVSQALFNPWRKLYENILEHQFYPQDH